MESNHVVMPNTDKSVVAPVRPVTRLFSAALVLTWILVSNSLAAAPLPELTVPSGFGVNIHFTGDPTDLDLIRAGGFRFIRMDLTWVRIEQGRGNYNFERPGYDALTDACTKRGIRILYILDYSNRLYESDRSVRTEEGRKAFAAFAEAAAKRYAGKGILWEVWNEPNFDQFWTPQPSVDDYCRLVEATAPLVKKADPSGLVVAPAASTIEFDWLEACFKNGLLKWIDVLSVHPYRPHPPETVIKDYEKLRELIKRYAPQGKDIPIISGEWGYSRINWDKARLSDETQARYLARYGIEKRFDLGNDKDFVFQLKNGSSSAIAIWTTQGDHQVTIALSSGRGLLIDMLGKRQEVSWKENALTLTVSQSPKYLLINQVRPQRRSPTRIPINGSASQRGKT